MGSTSIVTILGVATFMILTVLQTHYSPRLGSRALKRKYRITKSHIQKQTKAGIRKAKSRTIAAVKRQYFISHAYADMKVAVKRNEDIFINAIMFTLLVGFAATVMGAEIMLLFFRTAFDMSDATGINLALLIMQAGLVLSLLFVWLASFLLNMNSIAIMEGATLKKYKSVRRTIRKSLSNATRVTNAWLTVGLAIACPLLLAAIVSVIYMSANSYAMLDMLNFIPKMIIGAIAWVIFVIMNYSLVPYVALFEPHLKLRQAFVRSQELVRNRGRIFILMGYISLGAILSLGYLAAGFIEDLTGLSRMVTFSLSAFVMLLFANGIMVTLYRKRRLARKY